MRRLSGSDAIFLSTETPTGHMHVGGLVLLDPSDVPDFSFAALRDETAARIHRVPKFTWKLKEVPFGLDRPVWVDEPDFDPADHMHRVALPPPRTLRELGELVGDIMGHPLDRRRPLWELWYIEGLKGDKVALAMKAHHCLIDGVSGMGLAEILVDLEPDPPPAEPGPTKPAGRTERAPGDLELVARGLIPTARTPLRIARYATQAARRGVAMLPHLRRDDGPPGLADAPPTPWNAPISPRRRLAFASVPLDDVKTIRKRADVKVNDVILAICAGALREYLLSIGEHPDKPLITAVPISTRAEGDQTTGNQVANMMASLATDIDDPAERLQAIYRSTRSAKEMTAAVRAHDIQALGETAPPLVINLASRAMVATNLLGRMPQPTNVVISNVPGPPMPLYTCGARITALYPTGPFILNLGLNITVISYTGSVDFGFNADPELVPDLWSMVDGIPRALDELKAALNLDKAKRKTTRRRAHA